MTLQTNEFKNLLDARLKGLSSLCYEAEILLADIMPNGQRINFRRQLGSSMVALMLNNASSIVVLLKEESVYPAKTILRTLIEQLINLHYIYATPTYENLVGYLYDGDQTFIRNSNAAAAYMQSINQDGILDTMILDAQESIKFRSPNLLKKYGYALNKMPNLIDRAKMGTTACNLDLAIIYYYEYSELSTYVHASKDKLYHMLGSDTYDEWFQGLYGGKFEENALSIVNSTGDTIKKATFFLARKTRTRLPKSFKLTAESRAYFSDLSKYWAN